MLYGLHMDTSTLQELRKASSLIEASNNRKEARYLEA